MPQTPLGGYGALESRLYIDGAFADARDGATFPTLDPATNETIAEVSAGGPADVDRAVSAARRAFDEGPWPRMTAAQRAKVLRRLGELLFDHREELARLESRDAGKPFRETADRDVPRAADNCAFFAGAIEHREQSAFFDRKPFLGTPREIVSIVREEPVGVCALLTPWNSPLMQATWKIAPAIAAGNTCVLKPSELTPLSTLKLAELCGEAGVPDGVVNVVTGFGPQAGAPLVADLRVDAVAFTGSEPTGIAINPRCRRYAQESHPRAGRKVGQRRVRRRRSRPCGRRQRAGDVPPQRSGVSRRTRLSPCRAGIYEALPSSSSSRA